MEEFEKEVLNHKTMLPEQYKIMADLLFEKMKHYYEQSLEHEASDLREKCTRLYKKFSDNFTHNEFNMDVHYKMEFLKNL